MHSMPVINPRNRHGQPKSQAITVSRNILAHAALENISEAGIAPTAGNRPARREILRGEDDADGAVVVDKHAAGG